MRSIISGDRMVAFLIVDGIVYQSDIDHQECLQEYYAKTGQQSPFNLDYDGKDYEVEHTKATNETFSMKQSHTAYGFDLFDAMFFGWILVAHDEETYNSNVEWAKSYCIENDCKLGYFTNPTGFEVEVFN